MGQEEGGGAEARGEYLPCPSGGQLSGTRAAPGSHVGTCLCGRERRTQTCQIKLKNVDRANV